MKDYILYFLMTKREPYHVPILLCTNIKLCLSKYNINLWFDYHAHITFNFVDECKSTGNVDVPDISASSTDGEIYIYRAI